MAIPLGDVAMPQSFFDQVKDWNFDHDLWLEIFLYDKVRSKVALLYHGVNQECGDAMGAMSNENNDYDFTDFFYAGGNPTEMPCAAIEARAQWSVEEDPVGDDGRGNQGNTEQRRWWHKVMLRLKANKYTRAESGEEDGEESDQYDHAGYKPITEQGCMLRGLRDELTWYETAAGRQQAAVVGPGGGAHSPGRPLL